MMLKTLIAAIAAGACMAFSVQNTTVRKDKKSVPPGTVQISETFFADAVEISNGAWLEYEAWTKAQFSAGSAEHLATLPDTLVWRQNNSYNEPYVQHYYRHSAYRDYPVVGISYEQAVAFCKWRTERVKEFLLINKKKYYNIEYRLPSIEEWELLSTNGSGILDNGGMDEKGRPRLNCVRDSAIQKNEFISACTDVTAPVYSYWANRFGLYNTFGNVSEMVREKGISKGGGWRHRPENCRAGKQIGYDKPTAWLGFRCVCVVGV